MVNIRLVIDGIDVTESVEGGIEFEDATEDLLFVYRMDEFSADLDKEIFQLFNIDIHNGKEFLNKETELFFRNDLIFAGQIKEIEYDPDDETLNINVDSYGKLFFQGEITNYSNSGQGETLQKVAQDLTNLWNDSQNQTGGVDSQVIPPDWFMNFPPVVEVTDFPLLKSVTHNETAHSNDFFPWSLNPSVIRPSIPSLEWRNPRILNENDTDKTVWVYRTERADDNIWYFYVFDIIAGSITTNPLTNGRRKGPYEKEDGRYYDWIEFQEHGEISHYENRRTYDDPLFQNIASETYNESENFGNGYATPEKLLYASYIENTNGYGRLLRFNVNEEDKFTFNYEEAQIKNVLRDVCLLKGCLTWVTPSRILHFVSRSGLSTEIRKEPISYTYSNEDDSGETVELPSNFQLLEVVKTSILNLWNTLLGKKPTYYTALFDVENLNDVVFPIKGAKLFLLIEGETINAGIVKSTSYKTDEIIIKTEYRE